MRYKMFSERTGLTVSELALGTGMFGQARGLWRDPTRSVSPGSRQGVLPVVGTHTREQLEDHLAAFVVTLSG